MAAAPLDALSARVTSFARAELAGHAEPESVEALDRHARDLLRSLAAAGLLELVAPATRCADVCVAREALARASGLADTLFVMQGLGTAPIFLQGSAEQRARWVPAAARAEAIAAFALTEPGAGSDVGAIATVAGRVGDEYVLDGDKTFISNAGIADVYCVFARTGTVQDGRKGLSCFVVPAGTPGFEVSERLTMSAPHPIGSLALRQCRVPLSSRIGAEGDGHRIAMACLDRFRPTVGAAALGFAGRALDEATARARARVQFGKPIAEFQGIQFALADMATEIDAGRLLVARAAHSVDTGGPHATRHSAMAKLYATEAAQRVVDAALQIHGGSGLQRGHILELLYREVRALRIYEGTSEIQRLVIAREVLSS